MSRHQDNLGERESQALKTPHDLRAFNGRFSEQITSRFPPTLLFSALRRTYLRKIRMTDTTGGDHFLIPDLFLIRMPIAQSKSSLSMNTVDEVQNANAMTTSRL